MKGVLGVLGILIGLVLAGAGIVLFVWLLWWLWSQQEREEAAVVEIELDTALPAVELEVEEPEEASEEAPLEADEPQEAAVADDLKRIEGIGPRIAGVLQEAGIGTFARLAEMEAEQIKEVLAEVDPRLARLARPATWPEQAALAAEGQWEALEALQGELKGGRRD
jgi:predicted flap endonuclease-1-like 5' DNA nuclease